MNNEQEEKRKLWKMYGIFMGIMVGGAVLILGGQAAWNAIQQNSAKSARENQPEASETSSHSRSSSATNQGRSSISPSRNVQQFSTVNPFDRMIFPQNTCGDSLPTNPHAYPVNFYPVFIKSSERNLQQVRARFCRDAYAMVRKDIGEDAIQVASFSSFEKSQHFKNFMIKHLGSGEVGQPTTIESKR